MKIVGLVMGVVVVLGTLYLILGSSFSTPTSSPTPQPLPITQQPTSTPSTDTDTETNSDTDTKTDTINLFFIALEDNGQSGKKIGCNDSVVAVKQTIEPTTTPLQTALRAQLAYKSDYYGESGYYNSLSKSNLTVQNVRIENEVATIELEGNYTLSGTCDSPRFAAQLKETALQFPTITSVNIFINDIALADVLSEK